MHQGTRDTYNQSAGSLSEHYNEIGPREGDIDLAFILAGNPENASVFEIGCGNGRDAQVMLRRTHNYTGIDISDQMIALAKERAPEGNFEVADALTYEYQGPYDIVFAFASFRHLDIDEVTTVLRRIHAALKPHGVLYISSNYADYYHEIPREDKYGMREMHYYNPKILQNYAPRGLKKIKEIYDTVDGEKWFEVVFQKTHV